MRAGAGDAAAERRVRWAGLKGAERALEKAVRCYGGDVSRLCDVVRQVALLLHGGGGGGGDQIVAAVRNDA